MGRNPASPSTACNFWGKSVGPVQCATCPLLTAHVAIQSARTVEHKARSSTSEFIFFLGGTAAWRK
uniref:Uncharacterized protein n=1 Tax=Oryza brachyantha TaxID=4533 RepID=J3M8H5_ORYBR